MTSPLRDDKGRFIPKRILVCDRVIYGKDSFGREPQSWRVTHHLKRVEDDLDAWEPKDAGSQITKDICLEFREKDRQRQIENGWPSTRRYKLKYCRPEEATHVSLVSICGAQAPIAECVKVGVVFWSDEHIKRERDSAVSEFWLSNNFPTDWNWD